MESRPTAFAEIAYYRLLFLEGTRADLDGVTTALTAFRVRMQSSRAVDLVLPPFESHRRSIASPAKYAPTQALGSAMRGAGVELFRYPSARDAGGVGVGAFSPSVFGTAKPHGFETWHCVATKARVEFTKGGAARGGAVVLPRERFLVAGQLPWPAI